MTNPALFVGSMVPRSVCAAAASIAVLLAGGCGDAPVGPGKPPPRWRRPTALQTSDLASPDGRYRLVVRDGQTATPRDDSKWFWEIVLVDAKTGAVVFREGELRMIATLNIYWCWDEQNRFWVYNSDDGRIYYWEEHAGGWSRGLWGSAFAGKTSPAAPDPPHALAAAYSW